MSAARMDDPKKFDLWREFQNAALLLLHGHALRQRDLTCVFQFCRTPTFDDCTYWSMFKDHRKNPGEYGRCFAINGVWQKRADLERFHELCVERPHLLNEVQPSVAHQLTPLKIEALERFLADICEIRIPPFSTDSPFGLDGTAYAFSLKHNFLTADYSWWEAGPPEWRPMIDCLDAFVAWLESQPRTELKKLPEAST
jgi:hypothetical protein